MSENTLQLVVPTAAQLEWMDRGIGVIIHLDVQVFEPDYAFREQWGYTPDPAVFNPSELDTDQWIATAKAAGAEYAVLVAKHCSGFSLWPTQAHDYSVQSSPWKDGQGDIVGDFIQSCHKFGLKPGLYCSAATNAYMNVDNPGRVRTGDPEEQANYNRVIELQLSELWGNYGEIFYIWFDGGVLPPEEGGPDIVPLLEQLQPHAVVYQGPHDWYSLTRFTGNERGEAPDPFWNTTHDFTSDDGTVEVDDRGGSPDGARWVCGEADLPNRGQLQAFQGGWFWRDGEERYLYSVDHLVERYFSSIGRNTNLLIGMVVDDRGLVPDAERLQFEQFGTRMRQIFTEPVAKTAGTEYSLSLSLPDGRAPTVLLLSEDIAQGECVRRFEVEALMSGIWTKIWAGTVIGHHRIERFEPIHATELRLNILDRVASPQITEFSAWEVEASLLSGPLDMTQRCQICIQRGASGLVEMSCTNPALSLRYTLDGSEPNAESPIYDAPFALPGGGTVKAKACINHLSQSPTVTAIFGVDRQAWRVVRTSLNSPFPNGGAADVVHLLDDNSKTYWHTYHTDKKLSAPPHEVVLDMGAEREVAAFTFLPRNDGSYSGTPDQYAFYLSVDGHGWTLAAEGIWDDLRENLGMHIVELSQSVLGRYLRFVAKHAVDDADNVIVAGIGIIESKV
ncbi:alpha-L-fucosidase [Coraliomargarita algicola]|uniref:alpha-L-fucosidase n=1 Tax=Coraliomargarita algicola TaxID=3092156 RepID=A0ABZ0RQ26_9BACT|nr:alpha-L-fucosidase [Coraliomargarita sp. J2-16]WPJ97344.1 alpha-L-fucosidase [Coraliomargarita sp. J2-16]